MRITLSLSLGILLVLCQPGFAATKSEVISFISRRKSYCIMLRLHSA